MIEQQERRIGWCAWVLAWVGLVVGQLHALARALTPEGAEDFDQPLFEAWARPAVDVLSPLLTWASPEVVYVSYGKVWFPVFAACTLAAFVVYRRRECRGVERWAWRFTLGVYSVATLGVFLDYWTQWTGDYNGDGIEAALFTVGFLVTFPSLLLMLIASSVLGVILLRGRFRPRSAAAMLALTVPLAFAVLQVTSLGSVALPITFAFGLLGRRIARAELVAEPGGGVGVVRSGA